MDAEVSRIIWKLFVFWTSAPDFSFGLRSCAGIGVITDAQPPSRAKLSTTTSNLIIFLTIRNPPCG